MIDWQAVEVGDVVEFKCCFKLRIEDDPSEYIEEGRGVCIDGWNWEPLENIVAIHKKGTPGAMSHEERSRLWDKMEEYDVSILRVPWCRLAKDNKSDTEYSGSTTLEAVAACVAAIESQQKENANVE